MANSPKVSDVLKRIPEELLPEAPEKRRELLDYLFTHGLTSEKRLRDYLIRIEYKEALGASGRQRVLARMTVAKKWDMTPEHIHSILRSAGANTYS